ncbi:MAG: hypothetical protein BWY66_00569 [bacterium ADurb.Bin374]|nr:MAG: hypothetical protein BWY66_00569 [bacterium ADurb.Bin374]
MTQHQHVELHRLERNLAVDIDTMARGYLRYEALRKLNATQFGSLVSRNLAGENFDGMVDELILKGHPA